MPDEFADQRRRPARRAQRRDRRESGRSAPTSVSATATSRCGTTRRRTGAPGSGCGSRPRSRPLPAGNTGFDAPEKAASEKARLLAGLPVVSPEAEDDARGVSSRASPAGSRCATSSSFLLYASGLARFEAAFSGVLDELPERAEGDLRALLRAHAGLRRAPPPAAQPLARLRGARRGSHARARPHRPRADGRGRLARSAGAWPAASRKLTLDTPRNRPWCAPRWPTPPARIADAGLAAACRGARLATSRRSASARGCPSRAGAVARRDRPQRRARPA